jgi:hypothetical protein
MESFASDSNVSTPRRRFIPPCPPPRQKYAYDSIPSLPGHSTGCTLWRKRALPPHLTILRCASHLTSPLRDYGENPIQKLSLRAVLTHLLLRDVSRGPHDPTTSEPHNYADRSPRPLAHTPEGIPPPNNQPVSLSPSHITLRPQTPTPYSGVASSHSYLAFSFGIRDHLTFGEYAA